MGCVSLTKCCVWSVRHSQCTLLKSVLYRLIPIMLLTNTCQLLISRLSIGFPCVNCKECDSDENSNHTSYCLACMKVALWLSMSYMCVPKTKICPIVKLVSGLELKNKIHYLSVFAVSLRVFMRTSSLLYSVFSRELNQWTLLTQFAMYRKCTCVLALPGTHNPLIFFVVCKSIYVCDIIFVYSPQVHTCRTVIFCSARGRPIHARQW